MITGSLAPSVENCGHLPSVPGAPDPGTLGGGKMDPAKVEAVFRFPDYRNPKGEAAPAKPKRGRKGKVLAEAAVQASDVRILLNPGDPGDYETFLKVKSLPRYRFQGRTAIVPREYASRLGLASEASAAVDYRPHSGLFDYQRDISALAIRKRKFAAFVRPGLGKTFMESEFARHAASQLPADKCVLMLAPPMVVPQTLDEIDRFYGGEMQVEHIEAADLASWLTTGMSRIGIASYNALKYDTPRGRLGGLIPDESSVFKSFDGAWGEICIRLGKGLEWKLCGTGTPAPNDRIEYANHAVFLDAFPTVNSFLARYFVNKGQTNERWEMKPHALRPFYRSLSDWCIFLSDPGTYGWKDNAGGLPPVRVHIDEVPMTGRQRELAQEMTGSLIAQAGGIGNRSKLGQIAKGHYKGEQVPTEKPAFIRRMVESWPGQSTIIWCLFNPEQERLERELPGAASIKGATPHAERVKVLADYKAGRIRTLITKPEILGYGLNLQITRRMIFSGLCDSYEDYFQCICRANRVGSIEPLDVHIPVMQIERPMIETVLRKADRVELDLREQEALFREMGLGQFASTGGSDAAA